MEKYYKPLITITIIGNVVYVLWILFNAIDSGFGGSPVAIVSYIGLIALLIVNTLLIISKKRR